VIRDVYQRIDQAIGAMLNQVAANDDGRETTVIVLSDHGAGPFRWMINLNRWLAEAGYLHFRPEADHGLRRLKSTAIKRVALAYRRFLPAKWRAAVRTQLGARRFEQVKGEFESALLTTNVVWPQTRAYSLGAGGNIFLNVQGREPAGIVQPSAEYEQLRQEVAAALMTMRDPETGEAMVRRVYRREELYQGPFLEQAPDLIIEWQDYAYWGRGQYDSHAPVFQAQRHFDFSDQPLTGSHRPEGILIAYGPGIRVGAEIKEALHLVDLAPTILSLLGIAPSTVMDGRLRRDLFIEEQAEYRQQLFPANNGSTPSGTTAELKYSAEDEEKIAQHLRSLGYL
jgi:predicted AlkP superfamily phosphohydrolase/phosphomutase